jgi:hypothetical protein
MDHMALFPRIWLYEHSRQLLNPNILKYNVLVELDVITAVVLKRSNTL